MTHVLMVLSSFAFISAVLCYAALPPAPTSAAAVVGSMAATIVGLSLALMSHNSEPGVPTRLSGRSTFAGV